MNIYRYLEGLLGRGIGLSQGAYFYNATSRKLGHTVHPCTELDSNTESQYSFYQRTAAASRDPVRLRWKIFLNFVNPAKGMSEQNIQTYQYCLLPNIYRPSLIVHDNIPILFYTLYCAQLRQLC
jgi:hypothetical protein